MRKTIVASSLLFLPLVAAAQSKGELWEITMSMPGMPAGMVPPQRVCGGDDPERAAKQDPNTRDCKVTDTKKSANRTTVTMSCKDGSTMVVDQQYNAGRTEFKSTMSTKGGKQGDMTMNVTGRKLGACDAVAERKARDDQMAGVQAQVAAGQAQAAAQMKQSADRTIKECTAAVDRMSWRDLGMHGQCYRKTDAQCKQHFDMYNTISPEINKRCNASAAEFCKRFQTAEGFMKTQGRESQAQTCGVSIASIKAANCPKALQAGQLAFLGGYCPVEARPLAMEHCGGRDYTSRSGGKYARFCENYLANADFERPPGARSSSSGGGASGSKPTQPSQTDQVKDSVSKGVDKLRGLFGR